MNTWDDWSDFEISRAAAPFAIGGRKFTSRDGNRSAVCYFGSSGDYIGDFDINSCIDMWPIIFSKNISVINIKNTTQWFACTDVEFENICMSPDGSDSGISSMSANYNHYCTKPLRAAAIVFLMMNGVNPE